MQQDSVDNRAFSVDKSVDKREILWINIKILLINLLTTC